MEYDLMRYLLTSLTLLVAVLVSTGTEPPVAMLPPDPPAAIVDTPTYDAKGANVGVSWKQWGGCGVCVASENGKSLVVTCNHVFDENGGKLAAYPLECTVTHERKRYAATATTGDLDGDLAVLVVDGTLPVAAIAVEQPTAGTKVWRAGGGTGYQVGKVTTTQTRWVNTSCHFLADSVSESGDSGAGYFNERGELVAIHCGRADGLARGAPVSRVRVVVKDAPPLRLFPRLRDRLETRRAPAAVMVPPTAIVPPKKVDAPKPAPPVAVVPPPVTYSFGPTGGECVNGQCPVPSTNYSNDRPRLFKRR